MKCAGSTTAISSLKDSWCVPLQGKHCLLELRRLANSTQWDRTRSWRASRSENTSAMLCVYAHIHTDWQPNNIIMPPLPSTGWVDWWRHKNWQLHRFTAPSRPRAQCILDSIFDFGIIFFILYSLLVYIVCFPICPFSLLFPYLSGPSLIFSFENRPAPFPGWMS